MKNTRKQLVVTFFLLFMSSCSLFGTRQKNADVSIKSSPQNAKVLIYNQKKDTFQQIGQTPLDINLEKLQKNQGKTLLLKIEKEGHIPELITMPDTNHYDLKIKITLKKIDDWIDPNDDRNSRLIHLLGSSFRDIYRDIKEGRIKAAQRKISPLLLKYPKAAILHDIQGSIYLIRGETELAKKFFKKSLELFPDNLETQKALQNLRKKKYRRNKRRKS